MRLFDDRERRDTEPKGRIEPHFPYLNRTARPEFERARAVLEEWFSRYPAAHQSELRQRFRGRNDDNHRAAFFELFLHELLIQLACRVTVHPAIGATTSKTPDFLVEPPDGQVFYLEAVVAVDKSHEERAAEARVGRFMDEMNRGNHPNFFLDLDACNWKPRTPIPTAHLSRKVHAWLDTLDPDEATRRYVAGAFRNLPTFRFAHEGTAVGFVAIPKKREARGEATHRLIGSGPMSGGMVDNHSAIAQSLRQKASRYGQLDLPYVVAVNPLALGVDDDDVEWALFGREPTLEYPPTGQRAVTRKPHGVWTSSEGPVNTRVSAVLVVRELWPWSLRITDLSLFHNPWARRPYSSVLARFRQARLTSNGVRYERRAPLGSIVPGPETLSAAALPSALGGRRN
jgi:hypothetical protein